MIMTEVMRERMDITGIKWIQPDPRYDFYFSTLGYGYFPVMYIAIPEDHKFVNVDRDDLPAYGPEVNGGITFAQGNVFGWDYGHYQNSHNYKGDIISALKYFVDHYTVEELKTTPLQIEGEI